MLVDISPHFFRLVSSILPPPPASWGRTAPPPIKIHGPPIQVHGISASPPPASGTSPASPHVRLAQCKSLSHAGCLTLCLRKVKKNLFRSCCGRTPMSPFCVKHPQCRPMVVYRSLIKQSYNMILKNVLKYFMEALPLLCWRGILFWPSWIALTGPVNIFHNLPNRNSGTLLSNFIFKTKISIWLLLKMFQKNVFTSPGMCLLAGLHILRAPQTSATSDIGMQCVHSEMKRWWKVKVKQEYKRKIEKYRKFSSGSLQYLLHNLPPPTPLGTK